MITFISTQNHNITNPQGFWATVSLTVVALSERSNVLASPAFPEHLARIMYEPYDPGADSKGFSWIMPFQISVKFISSGCQSTVTAAITSRTILDSASDSVLVVVMWFGRHASQSYPLRSTPRKCCTGYGTSTPPEISSVLMSWHVSTRQCCLRFLDFPQMISHKLLVFPAAANPMQCHGAVKQAMDCIHREPIQRTANVIYRVYSHLSRKQFESWHFQTLFGNTSFNSHHYMSFFTPCHA